MHFPGFSIALILWILTFAATLVMLVVLMGRDRVRRFPLFTASIVLAGLRLLAGRLLFERLPTLIMSAITVTLANIELLVALLVLVELARIGFRGAKRRTWILWTVALVVADAGLVAAWGPWIEWKRLVANHSVALLNLLLVVALPPDILSVAAGLAKGCLFEGMLAVELGLLLVLFGRRFNAGRRSHTQQIAIGLSTVAATWLAVQGSWEIVARTVRIHDLAGKERVLALSDKLINAYRTVFLLALIWWIVCLWIDEPGIAATAELPAAEPIELPASASADAPASEEN